MYKNKFKILFFTLLHFYSRHTVEKHFSAQCAESRYVYEEQKKLANNVCNKNREYQNILPPIQEKPIDLSKNKSTILRKRKNNDLTNFYFNCRKKYQEKDIFEEEAHFYNINNLERKTSRKNLTKKAKQQTRGFLNTQDSDKHIEMLNTHASQSTKTINTTSKNIYTHKKVSETPNTIDITSDLYKQSKKISRTIAKSSVKYDLDTHINKIKNQKDGSEKPVNKTKKIDFNACIFTMNNGKSFLDFDKHFMLNRLIFFNYAEKWSHSSRVYNYHRSLHYPQEVNKTLNKLIDFILNMNSHSNEKNIKMAIEKSPLFRGNIKFFGFNYKASYRQISTLEKTGLPINHDIIFLHDEINKLYAILCNKLKFDMEMQYYKDLLSEFLIENLLVKKPTDEYYTLRSELFKLQLFMPEFYFNIIWILKIIYDPLQNQKYLNNFVIAEFENIYNLVLIFYQLHLCYMCKTENMKKLRNHIFTYRQFLLKKITDFKPKTMSATLYFYAFDHYKSIVNPDFQKLNKANLMFLMAFAPDTTTLKRFYSEIIYFREQKGHEPSLFEFFNYKLLRIKSHKQEMILIIYTLTLFLSKLKGKNGQIIFNSPI